MKDTEVIHGDCLEVMRGMDADSFDAIVTDPPYGLAFMGKDWDHGIPGVPYWDAALRVAKPGAHLLAFGGTRTFHRLTCAIEDAGWEIRDCIMWVYGSGFPKSLNVSLAIDKAAGAEREVVGVRKSYRPAANALRDPAGFQDRSDGAVSAPATDAARQWSGWGTALKPAWESIICARKPFHIERERRIIVENLSNLEAQLWSLLPANVAAESFGLSQNEYDAACGSARWNAAEKSNTQAALSGLTATSLFVPVVSSCLSIVRSWKRILVESCTDLSTFTTRTESSTTTDWKILKSCLSDLTPNCIIEAAICQPGCWWLALPAARSFNAVVANIANTLTPFVPEPATSTVAGKVLRPNWEPIIVARKPLIGTVAENVLTWGTGAMNVDGCRVATTDRLGGGANKGMKPETRHEGFARPWMADECHREETAARARAYTEHAEKLGRWPANLIHDGSEEVVGLFPQTTSGKAAAGGHIRHSDKSRNTYGKFPGERCEDDVLYGDSGSAARFFYCAKASRSERTEGNNHPTVKPLALMRYLCRLVTPAGGLILDPFTGSGTTGLAAIKEGFRFVGIEQEAQYVEIARQRMLQSKSDRGLFDVPVQEETTA